MNIFSGKFGAILLVVLFVGVAVGNALVTTGSGVNVTNSQVAWSHPVFLLPSGWAFSIWGFIYLLEAVFTLYQVLPSKWDDKALMSIRPWFTLAQICNVTWLFLFGNAGLNWCALVAIFAYEFALLKTLCLMDINYADLSKSWITKICVVAGISMNAGWVFVASLLQVNINLMDEGWIPSEDFAIGCIIVAVSFACYTCYNKADPFYAFASAWALSGIVSNQNSQSAGEELGDVWGTLENICKDDACLNNMGICRPPSETGLFAPAQGLFYEVCNYYSKQESPENSILIENSSTVQIACYFGIAAVLVSLVVGVVAQCCRKKPEETPAEMEFSSA